jgi:hypothetical protein
LPVAEQPVKVRQALQAVRHSLSVEPDALESARIACVIAMNSADQSRP